jgi:hypothetical protein
MHASSANEQSWVRLRSFLRQPFAVQDVASESFIAAGVVFAAALVSRTVWLEHAPFHPDESTVLWMALDAVHHTSLPDHGLILSYHAFQPPGLVWVVLPFVALAGGHPEAVIVGFGLINAAAIAFFAATVTREWGLAVALVTGAFTAVGPDAFMSGWVWHPSLYTAAMALLLAAAIRLRSGSRRWAAVIVAIPGLYALVHYSGLVLYGPAAVALVASRRLRDLWLPVLAGVAISVVAWARSWRSRHIATGPTSTQSPIPPTRLKHWNTGSANV